MSMSLYQVKAEAHRVSKTFDRLAESLVAGFPIDKSLQRLLETGVALQRFARTFEEYIKDDNPDRS